MGKNRRILDNFHHIAPFVYVQRCKACHNPFLNKCLKKKSCLLEERNLCSFQCMSRSCPDPMCYPRGRHDHVRYKNNKKILNYMRPRSCSDPMCFPRGVILQHHALCVVDMRNRPMLWWTQQYIVLSTAMPGDNSFLHRWLLFQIRRLVLCDT